MMLSAWTIWSEASPDGKLTAAVALAGVLLTAAFSGCGYLFVRWHGRREARDKDANAELRFRTEQLYEEDPGAGPNVAEQSNSGDGFLPSGSGGAGKRRSAAELSEAQRGEARQLGKETAEVYKNLLTEAYGMLPRKRRELFRQMRSLMSDSEWDLLVRFSAAFALENPRFAPVNSDLGTTAQEEETPPP